VIDISNLINKAEVGGWIFLETAAIVVVRVSGKDVVVYRYPKWKQMKTLFGGFDMNVTFSCC
jgi:hypothetical protein